MAGGIWIHISAAENGEKDMSIVDVSPKPPQEPVYIGDGLYAEFDGYQICLFSFNGVDRLAAVYLDPHVWAVFHAYATQIYGEPCK